MAFVSSYSHPVIIQTLKNQQIPLFSLCDITSIDDVSVSLREFGELIGKDNEAELLALFVEAAFCAIDNRFHTLIAKKDKKNVIYLNYHSHYALPTNRSLVGQMVARLGINKAFAQHLQTAGDHHWSLPISQEDIVHANPECIIISSPHHQYLMPANKECQFLAVDESVQETPSQYVALAYFDLYNALAEAYQQ